MLGRHPRKVKEKIGARRLCVAEFCASDSVMLIPRTTARIRAKGSFKLVRKQHSH